MAIATTLICLLIHLFCFDSFFLSTSTNGRLDLVEDNQTGISTQDCHGHCDLHETKTYIFRFFFITQNYNKNFSFYHGTYVDDPLERHLALSCLHGFNQKRPRVGSARVLWVVRGGATSYEKLQNQRPIATIQLCDNIPCRERHANYIQAISTTRAITNACLPVLTVRYHLKANYRTHQYLSNLSWPHGRLQKYGAGYRWRPLVGAPIHWLRFET